MKLDNFRAGLASLGLLLALLTADSPAQVLAPLPDGSAEVDPAEIDREVDAIYQLTQSAKTATEYSAILERCKQLRQQDIPDSDRAYLASLMSWAYGRRGLTRIDLAESFGAADNDSQRRLVLESAREDFDRSITLDRRRWRSYLGRGAVWAAVGDYRAAAEDFERVTQLRKQSTRGWFNLAEVRYELTEYAAACEAYTQVIEQDPADVQALTGRGHCHFAMSDYESALEDYRAAAALLPQHERAICHCGDALQMLERWQAALDCYRQAFDCGDGALGRRKAAWLLATCPDSEIADPEQARAWIDEAIAIGGETAERLTTLAATQAASGEMADAEQTRARAAALKADPGSPSARVAELPANPERSR